MPGGLKSLKNHKIRVPKSRDMFFLRSPKRRRQLRHSHGVLGGERARHSHILQLYRHPTSIQAPYKYTEILQVYSIQNTSPDTQNTSSDTQIQVQTLKIQAQTPKYKSRHPKYKSRHPKYKFRHPNTSPDTRNTSPDTQNTCPDVPNTYFRMYMVIYRHI